MKTQVAVIGFPHLGRYVDESLRAKLYEIADISHIPITKDQSPEKLAHLLSGYKILITVTYPGMFNRKFFEINGDIELLFKTGIGVDDIDLNAAYEHGVIVARMPGYLEREAVAEHTIALILSAIRKIPEIDAAVRRGEWITLRETYISRELRDLTVGLIGFGNIGSRVAEILINGFGSKVLVYDPYVDPERIKSVGAHPMESLEKLLESSDIISIHVPLTPETRYIINEKNIDKVKRGAIIVNTSRGEVIDMKALIYAIEKGIVSYVALDVLEGEPYIDPGHPLFKFKNVIVTPHIAARTKESIARRDTYLVRNIIKFITEREIDRESIVVFPRNPRTRKEQ